jgi:hypothetical protein
LETPFPVDNVSSEYCEYLLYCVECLTSFFRNLPDSQKYAIATRLQRNNGVRFRSIRRGGRKSVPIPVRKCFTVASTGGRKYAQPGCHIEGLSGPFSHLQRELQLRHHPAGRQGGPTLLAHRLRLLLLSPGQCSAPGERQDEAAERRPGALRRLADGEHAAGGLPGGPGVGGGGGAAGRGKEQDPRRRAVSGGGAVLRGLLH